MEYRKRTEVNNHRMNNSPLNNKKKDDTNSGKRSPRCASPRCASPQDPTSIEEYRRAFMFFDANKDGYITIGELESAMNKCGVFPSKLEVRVIMAQGDIDKNGVITFDEFIQMMRTQEKEMLKYSQTELFEQFRMFDRDNDGFIERSEMIDIVRQLRLGRVFPLGVIDQLFKEADVDGDGKISFQEFVMAVN